MGGIVMATRLKFLGLAVFFAMVTFLGTAFLANGMGTNVRSGYLAIAGGIFCLLSLVGVFAPKKMKWLLDGWNKKNGK